jgi:HAD superfamily hydrolase (TIGR01459 family)
MIPIADNFSALVEPYRAVLCDVWGVIHNGVAPFPEAVAALQGARASGKLVVLISNAPRPSNEIPAQLAKIGVADDAYDLIVTSGDATRACLAAWAAAGKLRIHHIGPARDNTLFARLPLELVALGEASHVVCTGPFDDEADTPEDYRETLTAIAAAKLPFLCANPDIVVQRGAKLIYCAGALAQELEKLGGEAIYPGKPHAPIYELALERLQDYARRAIGKEEILAVGDGLKTDILGAERFGIASVLIADGIHASGFVRGPSLDTPAIEAACREARVHPIAVMRSLKP